MATKEISQSKGSERLRSQNPTNADCVEDLHILFIHPAVNSLSWVQMPDCHLKRLRRSTACVFLPAFQIPAHADPDPFQSSERECDGSPVGLLLWPLGDSSSTGMQIWETGGRSVTQGQHQGWDSPADPRLCDVPHSHIVHVGTPCPEYGFFQRFLRKTSKLELSVSSS